MNSFFKKCTLGVLLFFSLSTSLAQRQNSIEESIAIVEWQFPTDDSLELHPFQKRFLLDTCCVHLHPAWAPNLSEVNAKDAPEFLNKLTQHAKSLYQSVVAGRKEFNPPFQLNFSSATPKSVEFLIQSGVRIFSLSSAIRDTAWKEFEDVIRKHPEVFFVVAIPHISGNSLAIEEIEEFPIRLVKEQLPNVVLAGEIRAFSTHADRHKSGTPLGSEGNPFSIMNQPGGVFHRRYYMLNPASTAVLGVNTRGGTSIAAPHLAHLISIALADLKSKNKDTSVQSTLRHLDLIMNETQAVEKKAGALDQTVFYFTLDTVLANLGERLQTNAVWNFGTPPLSTPQVFPK